MINILNGLTMSDQLDKIIPALVKVQKELEPALKDSKNPHFKSNYADIVSVWEASHVILPENGIAVHQGGAVIITPNGDRDVLVTTLLHESGQFISSTTPLILPRNDMQAVVAGYTYARRAGLAAAIFLVADDDDDGETAVGRGAYKKKEEGEEASVAPKIGVDMVTAKNFWSMASKAGMSQQVSTAMKDLSMKPTTDANAKAIWTKATAT